MKLFIGQSSDDSPAIALPSEEPVPEYIQLGCAAALVCVEEQFCDLAGVITKSPNSFSPAQLLRRVPMIVSFIEVFNLYTYKTRFRLAIIS